MVALQKELQPVTSYPKTAVSSSAFVLTTAIVARGSLSFVEGDLVIMTAPPPSYTFVFARTVATFC